MSTQEGKCRQSVMLNGVVYFCSRLAGHTGWHIITGRSFSFVWESTVKYKTEMNLGGGNE